MKLSEKQLNEIYADNRNHHLSLFLGACEREVVNDEWGNPRNMSLQYLSDQDIINLVDWWKKHHTEQKEYYLVVNPDALKIYGSEFPKYVNQIEDMSDHFTFHYGVPTRYSEAELETIKQVHPTIAPAIDAMKTPVEDE